MSWHNLRHAIAMASALLLAIAVIIMAFVLSLASIPPGAHW